MRSAFWTCDYPMGDLPDHKAGRARGQTSDSGWRSSRYVSAHASWWMVPQDDPNQADTVTLRVSGNGGLVNPKNEDLITETLPYQRWTGR